ncbi:DUF4913 domain-containing protein [Sinomonas terrae]|uniref:DUF4913 domain-containing protein n=1 Tax=Sinomonas terrae TaxID=2908838 RepID=A0ABS9U796_9MICC|nr:DUF4913 domain-containing protein [Sinomonas terrae]MCH6472120.1 DUF4913 domain-containing protein [Sinomonas terrae]
MRKLWSAANSKVYGGGVAEADFLGELAQTIGGYRYSNATRSRQGGTCYSHRDDRKERILDVADLAALPRGRAVMFACGAPAALLKIVPWKDGPHADAVAAASGRRPRRRHLDRGPRGLQAAAGASDPSKGRRDRDGREGARVMLYPDVADFVGDQLAVTYRKRIDLTAGITWCPKWWKYAGAISPLEALGS